MAGFFHSSVGLLDPARLMLCNLFLFLKLILVLIQLLIYIKKTIWGRGKLHKSFIFFVVAAGLNLAS